MGAGRLVVFPFWFKNCPGTHTGHTGNTGTRITQTNLTTIPKPNPPTHTHDRDNRIRGRISQNPFNTGRLLIPCNSHNAPHLTHKCGKMLHVHLDRALAAKESRIFFHIWWWKGLRKVRIVLVPQSDRCTCVTSGSESPDNLDDPRARRHGNHVRQCTTMHTDQTHSVPEVSKWPVVRNT